MKRNSFKHSFPISQASWFKKGSGGAGSHAATIARLLCVLLLAAGCAHTTATVKNTPATPIASAPQQPKRAEFGQTPRSMEAEQVANWVVDSGDNQGMPFALVDKTDAKLFVFEPGGHLQDVGPCLVGLAKGDVSEPDIGKKKLSQVRPSQRTTPAGRFVACMGVDVKGKTVLWVDYHGAVAIHRVVTNNPKEHRLERLASSNPSDHRISWGCINVPYTFFDNVIKPAFSEKSGVVYVLPEVQSNEETFKSYYRVELKGKSAAP